MTWGAIIGGALGAGSTLYGANVASRSTGGTVRAPSIDPTRDPLLGGLSIEALLGMGSTAGLQGFQESASPMNQFIDGIMRSDQLSAKQKRRATNAIRWYEERGLDPFDTSLLTQVGPDGRPLIPGNIRGLRGEIMRATQTVGFGGFGDWAGMMNAENQYQQDARTFQARAGPLANTIRDNRLQGVAGLADIAGNAGLRTDELAALYEPQIARQFQDQRENILQAANQGRFNPGSALGRLGETQALTQKTSAIERALQILGGQSNIIQGALAPAQNLALQTSGQRQGGSLNLANIGAAQSQAQAQLAQQNNVSQGTGIASAGSQLGNVGMLLALLKGMNPNQNPSGGPGASGGTGATGASAFESLMGRQIGSGLGAGY